LILIEPLKTMKIHRYPGVKPFTENEKHLFFGRANDSQKLFKLISLEKLVLLYSKSGLGKSSLLNAGVLPLFDELENNRSIKIRLSAKTENSLPPSQTCLLKLPLFEQNKILQKLNIQDESLWLRMKSLQSISAKENKTYLLVFDQFEELFTYPSAEIDQFKRQLSDLLYTKIPAYLRKSISNRLKEDEHFFSDSDLEYLNRPLNVKVIFSIRSDRMSLLNQLTDLMPDILKNYYELGALDRKSAIQAIVEPAKELSHNYLSPQFTYSAQSINEILDYLTAKGEKNIETFQLQTICQYSENITIEKFKTNSQTTERLEINTEDLGDLKNVFRSHYDNLISKLPNAEQQLAARLLIENKLIIDNNRVSLPDVVVMKEQGVNKELIAYLHDEHHIIRSEPNTTGTISYELSHDTLVAPILEAKKVREEAEEEARAKAEQLEKLRQAQEAAERERTEREKERKRQRKVILMVGSVALVAILLAIFALFQMQIAKTATEEAEKAQIEAQESLNQFKIAEKARQKTEANSLFQKAKNLNVFGEKEMAIKYLKLALEKDSTHAEAKKMLENLTKRN